jgi:phosphoribosylglycinamide formyltransferase-1
MARLKAVILVSGRGSNLQALIESCRDPHFPVIIDLVLSNNPEAYALERAKAAGIKTIILNHHHFSDRSAFDQSLHKILCEHQIDLICLAGFMRLLTADFVTQWPQKIINIHPSLLPAFKGLHTHKRALEAGVKIHGCTVHFVTPDLDDGPIIAQSAISVFDDDTEDSLAARVLEEEHRLYPQCLKLIGEGRFILKDRRIISL